MRSKKKIIILLNTITPYQLDFFEELKKKVELKIIFYSKNYNNYKFNFKKEKNHIFLDQTQNILKTILLNINNFNPDLVIVGGYRLKYSLQIVRLFQKKKINFFYWLENLNKNNLIKYNIVKLLIGNRISKSNGVLTVGEDAKKLYRKFNKNVINLPYSIKIKPKKKKIFYKNNKVNFLFVGQLIERKGLHFIFKAFNSLSVEEKKKITLRIVGEGNLKKKLTTFMKKNSYVKYHGFLHGKKLEKIYSISDILVFPSIFDGWGVVPMEAMDQSLSIILSKNAGVSEIVKHKKNGYIIEPNMKSLLKTIQTCIKKPKIIKFQGIRNKKLISDSICNSKKSANYLIKKAFRII